MSTDGPLNQPAAYRWAYDRNTWDSNQHALTFSVGVYQWLPKASGKGFKKSKTIRVMGYTSEALRVYNKANELCKRLNSDQIRIERPPKWLQKQYSVPRPENLMITPDSTRLDPARVRRLREQVMKSMLQPIGFVKASDASYVRKVQDQYHLINFQANKYGGSYTINLGFHYSFIPTLHRQRTKSCEFHLLDCVLQARLGSFLEPARDTWFDYGDNASAFKARLARNINHSIKTLDNYAELWKNSSVWLKALSPKGKLPGDFYLGWRGHPKVLLICVAIHLRKFDIAKQLLNLPENKDLNEIYKQWCNSLLRRMTKDKSIQFR